MIISVIAYGTLVHYYKMPVKIVYDKYFQLITSGTIFSFVLSTVLYLKARRTHNSKLAPGGNSGILLYNIIVLTCRICKFNMLWWNDKLEMLWKSYYAVKFPSLKQQSVMEDIDIQFKIMYILNGLSTQSWISNWLIFRQLYLRLLYGTWIKPKNWRLWPEIFLWATSWTYWLDDVKPGHVDGFIPTERSDIAHSRTSCWYAGLVCGRRTVVWGETSLTFSIAFLLLNLLW